MRSRMRFRVLTGLAVAAAFALAAGSAAGAEDLPEAPEDPAAGEERPRTGFIAPGVAVDGVDVGGLTRNEAVERLLALRAKPALRPVPVRMGPTRFTVRPRAAGLAVHVRYAVRAAYNFGRTRPVPEGGASVPLRITVNEKRVRAIVRARAQRYDRTPRSASLSFRGSRPVVTKARSGRAVVQGKARAQLRRGLRDQRRRPVAFPTRRVRPERTAHPPAVLIDRANFRLTLFTSGARRSFRVAVGQAAYPTPPGRYTILTKQVNPTWFPPSSPWAAGIGPVGPGPGNPLGTRWMGLDRNLIGIHGTPSPGTLGTRASHGCIRMRISEAEWLFDRVGVGTQVVIV